MNSRVQATLFSSTETGYRTPAYVFGPLDDLYHFDLDAAASHENALCARFFTEAENGLAQPWDGAVFVNPPYGRKLTGPWVMKALQEVRENPRCRMVALLLPARTSQDWWHDGVMHATEVGLVAGRIVFNLPDGTPDAQGAPFPSAIVTFMRGAVRPTPRFYTLSLTHPKATRRRAQPRRRP